MSLKLYVMRVSEATLCVELTDYGTTELVFTCVIETGKSGESGLNGARGWIESASFAG